MNPLGVMSSGPEANWLTEPSVYCIGTDPAEFFFIFLVTLGGDIRGITAAMAATIRRRHRHPMAPLTTERTPTLCS